MRDWFLKLYLIFMYNIIHIFKLKKNVTGTLKNN